MKPRKYGVHIGFNNHFSERSEKYTHPILTAETSIAMTEISPKLGLRTGTRIAAADKRSEEIIITVLDTVCDLIFCFPKEISSDFFAITEIYLVRI